MSDPLWFLENLEDNERKSDQKDFTLSYINPENPGKKEGNSDEKSVVNESQSREKSKSQNEGETKSTKVIDLLKDEESLRIALQNSLIESIKNGQNPEIQITVNSKPESSGNNMEGNGNFDSSSPTEKSKLFITLNKKENGDVVGEEKKFVVDNSNGQTIEVNENGGKKEQQTVYVILPPEQNAQSNVVPASTDTKTKYLEEVGSTVINLNDLIASKGNEIGKNGEITANIDLSSIISSSGEVPKVEFVIKVKDDRENIDPPKTTEKTIKTYTESELARVKELLKNSATLESLETQLQSGKEVRNIPIQVSPSTSSWQTYESSSSTVSQDSQKSDPISTWRTTYESTSSTVNSQKSDPTADWVDKTTDSFVRRDGSQCTRTVWSTPQGRRVETKCFRDDRSAPSQRGRRYRDLDWSPRFGSLWRDLEHDIDRIFSYSNRFF